MQTGYIGITDFDWYQRLFAVGSDRLEEANFWQPSGGRITRLQEGTPFLFKLHKRNGGAICGFGLYARGVRLPIREAWNFFGVANGVSSERELVERVRRYRRGSTAITANDSIGCHLLLAPVLFPLDLWIPAPSNWHDNIVQGASRPLEEPELARIWAACLSHTSAVRLGDQTLRHVEEAARFGRSQLTSPRLGQGVFRAAVLDAYDRACAIKHEHSIPVLEAAHILPYAAGGTHEVSNGLLLRADVHKLFDAGYVTVTPEARFEVSRRLRDDFDNGRVYYGMHGQPIALPARSSMRPSPERLAWHNENVFLASTG